MDAEPDIKAAGASGESNAGLTRRSFLRTCALTAATVSGIAVSGGAHAATAEGDERYVRRALYYKRLPNSLVRCELCPRYCYLPPGKRGFCGVRENRNGDCYTVVYGRACTTGIDPIEKKPLYHYLPGSSAYSFATAGCNLACNNCQNWQISRARPEQLSATWLPPAPMVRQAVSGGARVIAGTYSEPTVFYEYLEEVAKEARKQGLRTVAISSGFINPRPMRRRCQALDAIKIDLKSFRESFYSSNCSGHLKPVLEAIAVAKATGIWLELVYLVIPTMNDSVAEIRDLARWVKSELGVETPLHFSRFRPEYRLTNLPPTPLETLTRCRDTAMAEGLHFVYVGNVPSHPGEHTYCPKCGRVLIERRAFVITQNHLSGGKCKYCGAPIPGVWA